MGNIFKKAMNVLLGTEEEYEEEYEEYEDEVVDTTKKDPVIPYKRAPRNAEFSHNEGSNIVNLHTTVKTEVVLTSPKTVEEAGTICDFIKANKSVVLNLEDVNYEIAQRIIDFVGGVIYALDGDIRSISNKVFILAPKNVEISSLLEDKFKGNGSLFSFPASMVGSYK